MRWKIPVYKNFDRKYKKKFAILPIRINDEVRWLEWVTIEYEYNEYINKWYVNGFVDNKVYSQEV